MDLVAKVRRMPVPGETIKGETFELLPGGKGANQAVAAARLGGDVAFVGCVGTDPFGAALLENLEQEGVKTTSVRTVRDASSGVALIHVDAGGQNAITVIPGANEQLTVEHIRAEKDLIRSGDAVLLQLEIPLEVVAETIALASGQAGLIVLDPAPAPQQLLPEPLYTVDILTPNQVEVEMLTGISVRDTESARRAGAVLIERGARSVVIKAGEQGAYLIEDPPKVAHHVAAQPTKVLDTTAAGDAFTAAMALAYTQGHALEQAVRVGCEAGAIAVSRRGAQPSMPFQAEVPGVQPRSGQDV